MSEAKTPKEVLQAMEWMLENVGWTRAVAYRNKDGIEIDYDDTNLLMMSLGSMCLLGAENLVEANEAIKSDARRIFLDANKVPGLVWFNDLLARDKEDVIQALRKAIKKASK